MNRFRLVRVLLLANATVGLYVIIIAAFHFGLLPFQSNESLAKTVEYQKTLIHPENIQIKGLNLHIWEKNCQISLEQLCSYPIFPKAPDKRSFAETANFTSTDNEVDGLRLLGFLRPNETGEYLFFIASNGFAEVWLSTNRDWKNGEKIAHVMPREEKSRPNFDFGAMKSMFSQSVRLLSRQTYYIEIIYAGGSQSKSGALIQVAWKRPDSSGFEIIDEAFLTPFTNDSDKAKMKVYDDDLPDVHACALLRLKFANKYMRSETLSFLESTAVNRALDFCEYRPGYVLKPASFSGFKQYDGVKVHTHNTFSFPYVNVDGIAKNQRAQRFFAENPLEEKEAWSVVNRYMVALEDNYPGKYKLESIKSVEMKKDPQKGARYLLELIVQDLTNGRSYILAEYVFQPNGKNGTLCYPKGLQWNRTADVYLILTAKNLGRWVHHFIKNIEKIVQETKDEHLYVVVYDFDSPDIDLKQAFQKSTLKNFHYIRKPGKYSRTVSFSEAIESIKDPNAIVVTIDLHLDIGGQTINDVRKHCSKGRTLYAPQIVSLSCGGSSTLPNGVWYHYSYGTIAMYKQDWESFGGFSQRFEKKETWGGEDWDIIDGAVKSGLEIERKRSPWVYHYYHTKAGMW